MARLVVDSRGYKNSLDSKDYMWLIGRRWVILIKKKNGEKFYIPIEAINYLYEIEDKGAEGNAKGKWSFNCACLC
jgi:hypothetical protein